MPLQIYNATYINTKLSNYALASTVSGLQTSINVKLTPPSAATNDIIVYNGSSWVASDNYVKFTERITGGALLNKTNVVNDMHHVRNVQFSRKTERVKFNIPSLHSAAHGRFFF